MQVGPAGRLPDRRIIMRPHAYSLLALLFFPALLFPQWSTQTSPTASNLYDIQFIGKQYGWIVGNDWVDANSKSHSPSSTVFLRTTDAGGTWMKQSIPGTAVWKLKFLNTSLGWAVGETDGHRGLILKTTNGGVSWNTVDSSFSNMYMQAISIVDSLHMWIIAGSSSDTLGRIYRSINGGSTWIAVDSPKIAEPNDMFFVDTLKGFAVGEFGGIVRTVDGGVTWQQVVYVLSQFGNFSPLRKVFFTTRDSGWAIGGISGVETKVRTTDGGATWQTSNTFVGSSLHGLHFADSRNGWTVGGVNAGLVIERTTDGGITWTKQQQPFGFPGPNYFEAVYMINASEGWIVGDLGSILRTTNAGLTSVTTAEDLLPAAYKLSQNYPNPFNPSTVISYQLPVKTGIEGSSVSRITLKVFDQLGREVATLVDAEQQAGTYTVQFDAHSLASGVYFYRIVAADASMNATQRYVETKKLMIVK
jgi:photosystem II stability/assembly factor-like uncharacterized protein